VIDSKTFVWVNDSSLSVFKQILTDFFVSSCISNIDGISDMSGTLPGKSSIFVESVSVDPIDLVSAEHCGDVHIKDAETKDANILLPNPIFYSIII
jgi:hypothetical protein